MQLAVLDLAGTTMADDGLVLAAFRAGLRAARVRVDGPCYPALDRQARATMDRPARSWIRPISSCRRSTVQPSAPQ